VLVTGSCAKGYSWSYTISGKKEREAEDRKSGGNKLQRELKGKNAHGCAFIFRSRKDYLHFGQEFCVKDKKNKTNYAI
jgi:hypothetical protein